MNNQTVNRIWVVVLGLMILGGGIWGFGHKFLALVRLAMNEQEGADAAFAVAPVVNYLLASLGFLCLVGWAASHRMFHDIEGPKYAMLETEARLDAAAGEVDYSQSVMQ